MKDFPQRSQSQNKAIHLWFEQIAEEFNGAGYEQKITFGTIDAPWTKETIKVIFRKVAYAMYNKNSTADLTTKELTHVAEVINRGLAEEGIHIPFPSIQEILITLEQ